MNFDLIVIPMNNMSVFKPICAQIFNGRVNFSLVDWNQRGKEIARTSVDRRRFFR